MIVLDLTTKKLELETSAAVSTDFYTAGLDRRLPLARGRVSTDRERSWAGNGNTAAIGTITIAPAPAAGSERWVQEISITNVGGASQTVIVKLDVSATDFRIIGPVTLLPGESLLFSDET